MIRTRLRTANYLKAAKKVLNAKEGGEFSCVVLDCLRTEECVGNLPERRAFALLFSPRQEPNAAKASYQKKDWWSGELSDENQHKRSIALLLMYEIAKDDPYLYEAS